MRPVQRILAISDREALLDVRGFQDPSSAVRKRLEGIGVDLIAGYRLAITADQDLEKLFHDLDESVVPEQHGFAYEGAAMGLFLLDSLASFRGTRFERFVTDPRGNKHVYMSFVGAGLAGARLPWIGFQRLLERHPLLCWLAIDGVGFHHGFFNTDRTIRRCLRPRLPKPIPAAARPYYRRAFDQGVGRSLWFAEVCNPQRVARRIQTFNSTRHPDLWSGVGLAACYVGTQSHDDYAELVRLSGSHYEDLSQGVVFAAAARARAGLIPQSSADACMALTGVSALTCQDIAEEAETRCQGSEPGVAYEQWRTLIRGELAALTMDTSTGELSCVG